MPSGGDVLQEYVVKLTTIVDNQGVQSILRFLDSGKLKAMGITAAISGATTAVYSFIKSAAEGEKALDQLARKQKKNVEDVRASETALKSMGKTIKEVKKDADLKKTYEQLVKINKEMALPNMKQTLGVLNNLRFAFAELKSAAQYAIDWIGARVLRQLEEPIKRITEKLSGVAKWIRDNMVSVTTKIGSILTGFAKGVIGIVEGFSKITKFVNDLDPGIRKLGTAISIVFAILKSGPVGQILAAITMIGGLIDDYENFMYNRKSGVNDSIGQQLYNRENGYFDENGFLNEKGKSFLSNNNIDPTDIVGVGFSGLWGTLFPESGEAQVESALSRVLSSFNEKLLEIQKTLREGDLFGWLKDPSGELGGWFGKIAAYFESDEGIGQVQTIITNLIGAFGQAVALVGRGGTTLLDILFNMLFGTGEEQGAGFEGNTVATGLMAGLGAKLFTKNNIVALISGITAAITEARNQVAKELGPDATEDEINTKVMETLGIDFTGLLEKLLGHLRTAIATFNKGSNNFLKALIGGLFGDGNEDTKNAAEAAMGQLDQDNAITGSIASGIVARLLGASTGQSIFVAIGNALATYTKDANGLKQLQEDFQNIIDVVETLWFGTLEEGPNGPQRADNGLRSFLKPLWDKIVKGFSDWFSGGEDGEGNVLLNWFVSMWAAVQEFFTETVGPWVSGFFHEIWTSLYNSLDGTVKTLLWKAGIKDPNKSTVTRNEDGTYTISSTNNQKLENISLTDETAARLMALQDHFAINNGTIYGTNALYGNKDTDNLIANLLGGQWDERIASALFGQGIDFQSMYKAILHDVFHITSVGTPEGGTPTYPDRRPSQLPGDKNNPKIVVGADTKLAVAEIEALRENIRQQVTIPIDIEKPGEDDKTEGPGKAWGGRIGQQVNGVTLGEDGTEYVIPITKTERAASLIKQMLTEMGGAFTSRIMADLGLGAEGTIGSGLGSIASALSGGSGVSMTYNVSAPVSITVSASGVSAEGVGEQAYNLASRYLVRTLQGVFA